MLEHFNLLRDKLFQRLSLLILLCRTGRQKRLLVLVETEIIIVINKSATAQVSITDEVKNGSVRSDDEPACRIVI